MIAFQGRTYAPEIFPFQINTDDVEKWKDNESSNYTVSLIGAKNLW